MYASRAYHRERMHSMAAATIKAALDYFGRKSGQTLKDITEEWKKLTEQDKEQLKEGIGNGTLTY